MARRVGPGLSLEGDRIMMVEQSHALDAEAAGLEAEADKLDRSRDVQGSRKMPRCGRDGQR
jgi:hypothetical protein